MQRIRADAILRAIQKMTPKGEKFFAEVKTGPSLGADDHVRLDAVWIRCSWTRPRITGFEIKVDRSDYINDSKWPVYKSKVHRFFFVCPSGLIHPEEVDPDVGLYWYDPETQRLRCRKSAPHRDVPLDAGMLYYLVMWRIEPHRHPFFSTEREYLEAWLEDKAERRILGRMVGTRMAKRLEEAERRIAQLELELEVARKEAAELQQMREFLSDLGIWAWRSDWMDQLRQALLTGVTARKIMPIVESLRRNADELEKMVREAQGAACDSIGRV